MRSVFEHKSPKYSDRTADNANIADLTVAFAVDFSTLGEKLTKKVSGARYVAIDLCQPPIESARRLYKAMAALQAHTLNIAGNGIYTLREHGIMQSRVTAYVFEVLRKVHEHLPIKQIYSGGQTGVDLAGVVAGVALNIPVQALLPAGYLQRDDYGRDARHFSEDINSQIDEGVAFLRVWQRYEHHAISGSVRVVSKRKDGVCAQSHEYVMDGDRKNPVFGNPVALADHGNVQARARVIEQYRREVFEPDVLRGGIIFEEMIKLAKEVEKGTHLALACWCKPDPCHLDFVADGIIAFAEGRQFQEEMAACYGSRGIELFFTAASPFSNWHPCEFRVMDVMYCCMEQYMMHQKAVQFGDEEIAARILATKKPGEHKAFGRRVRGFDDAVWKTVREDVILRGLVAKYAQNKHLGDRLLRTGTKILAEASPTDTTYGIGLASNDSRALDLTQWRGENLLGKLHERARLLLREEFMVKPGSRQCLMFR